MTRLYVRIITDDKRFERMLELEISCRGAEILKAGTAHSSKLKAGKVFTLADLDFCNIEDIAEYSSESTVIGFSRSYKNALGDVLTKCNVFLHRPFLMEDLISSIFGESDSPKRRAVSQVKEKEHRYLSVDEVEHCAVFGNERIMLSDSEYKVLSLLCERRGETVGREELSRLLGSSEGNLSDVYICMLRRKIDNRLGLKLISTVRGKGYMISN